jgi:hypothetical protein
MESWTRDAVLGESYTPRPLDEFLAGSGPVSWTTHNPYAGIAPGEVLDRMCRQTKWRYHHDIPRLRQTTGFYEAYSRRVDALLEMLDNALEMAEVPIASSSFIDIAAAEGYVTNHLHGLGARDIDAIELNQGNLERMWMVRRVKDVNPGRTARLDLEMVDWSEAFDVKYDVTLALGIVYHMENPILFLRNLFDLTNRVSVIECDTPVFPGNERFRGHGIIYLHRDQVTLAAGRTRHFTEMRPDRQALVELVLSAGFNRVMEVPPSTTARFPMFETGEKTVLLAIR